MKKVFGILTLTLFFSISVNAYCPQFNPMNTTLIGEEINNFFSTGMKDIGFGSETKEEQLFLQCISDSILKKTNLEKIVLHMIAGRFEVRHEGYDTLMHSDPDKGIEIKNWETYINVKTVDSHYKNGEISNSTPDCFLNLGIQLKELPSNDSRSRPLPISG